ncbi:hypothetical protein N7539_003495 [Penicillium diatomitis]|uniref:Transglutaminase-like domain-containing protein n=1 Tax=Penicillium diatomitis TaxID=2819901 RepID=A0A9X0BXB9_9EURO|nr:uncharacterized protein N7539_003495 [Penicillium diatomitis]KAJ5488605.1 hypothetical protein N7539_003495 [Penicillium diatomitis]
MTEELQLGSISERIAALKLSQAAQSSTGAEPPHPFIRPATERSRSANIPPSYAVTGTVTNAQTIGNEPASLATQRPAVPPTPSPRLEIKAKKPPPPLPTRRSGRPPAPPLPPVRSGSTESSTQGESRPSLPPRRPTQLSHKPSQDSVLSNTSRSSTATSVVRGASSTSVNSVGQSRIKAPAWGETELPSLPPRRPRDDPGEVAQSTRLESKSSSGGGLTGGFTGKLSALRGKIPGSSSSSSSSASKPSRPTIPSRPSARATSQPPGPRLPPRRPSEAETSQGHPDTEEYADDARTNLPSRRLPPSSDVNNLADARTLGFGGLTKRPSVPAPLNSTPTANGSAGGPPPPVPTGSRPDLAKLNATKPRFHGSLPGATAPLGNPSTECLICHDFSGPDARAAQYPRQSLPTQDIGWLANELTAPFPSLTDKARAIFTWLHHNIEYDVVAFFNNDLQPSTPASTFSSGLAVCEGYATLFALLATKAGLEAIVVGGHGKGFGHEDLAPGQPVPPYNPSGHAWNAVKIDGGQWKLIDACWGAGVVQGPGQPYIKRFEPHMFTISNEEFGLKHFPSNRDHFFRSDGRQVSWEEYITTNPDSPQGGKPLKVWSGLSEHSIGRKTILPAEGAISISNTPGPIRFQFGLLCEHWTLARHNRQKPGLFLLEVHGVDGRKDERFVFNHVPGNGPGGGGEAWYLDIGDARQLGAPGQKISLIVLNTLGDRHDCRGLTAEEYKSQVGRVGMSWSGLAEWTLER